MKISVVTVCYNAVQTLEKTVLSVLNQTYPDVEYIIIDGGSTDGTVDIIKKYADKLAYWVSEPDDGIYDAMNKGIKYANGDYLIFLGADDLFFSDETLSVIVPKLEKEEVYYGDSYMTRIRKIYWGRFNKYKLAIGNICHQAIFYPKYVYMRKEYETRYRVYADYVYNIELFDKVKFNYLDETVSIFTYGGTSFHTKDKYFEATKKRIIYDNLGFRFVLVYVIFEIYQSLKSIFS